MALLATLARAEETLEPVRFSFSAPPGCPSEAEVRDALAEKLGADVIAKPDQLARKLDITIEPKEGGFHARLALVDRAGETLSRDVSAPTCAQATNAIVLVAALAARAQREDRALPAPPVTPKPATEPTPTPSRAPPPRLPPTPLPRSPAPDPITPELFGALGVATGVGPSLSPGAMVGGRARFTHVGPSVGLLVGVHDTFRTDAEGVDARFRRVAVRAELCPYEPALSSALSLSPCLGLELGAHTGRAYSDGVRVVASRTESLLWSQTTLAVRLRVARSALIIDFGPELGLVFTRNIFAIAADPDDVVYQTPRFATAGRASIGVTF